MKIVCDACGAKYAIADEKVRGKVFKIRCKKCSNVIVVRGSAGDGEQPSQAEPQQETRTFDYAGYDNQEADAGGAAGGEGVWHLVIDQGQVGPLTEQEIQQRFAAGEIDRETYAWREGFDDWVPLGSIPDFADLGAEAPASGGDAGGGMFAAAAGEANQGGADPFASAAAQGAEGGSDLFGGPGAAAAGGDGLFGSGDSGASDAADRRLRGERNENSVLFSLNNLAALASDTPKAASSGQGAGSGSAPGMAQAGGGEGSGLIDIRSLAQLYTDDKPRGGGGGAQAGSPLGAIEPVAFPAQSSVLLPTAPAASNNNKTLYIVLGVAGALLAAAIVLVVVVLSGGDKAPAVAAVPAGGEEQLQGVAGLTGNTAADQAKPDSDPGKTAEDSDPGKAAGDSDPGKTAGGGDEPKQDDENTKVAAAGDRDNDKDDGRRSRSNDDSSRRSRDRDSSSAERRDPKPEKSSGGSAPSGGGGGKCLDEVGCLLADHPPPCCSKYGGGGGGGGGGRSGGGSSSNSNLPDSLDRGDITKGINKVRGRVSGCGSKHPGKGQVKVSVKVTPGGSVGSVSVKSAPNSALGNCVASAVKGAKFAKTQKGGSFTYPFVF